MGTPFVIPIPGSPAQSYYLRWDKAGPGWWLVTLTGVEAARLLQWWDRGRDWPDAGLDTGGGICHRPKYYCSGHRDTETVVSALYTQAVARDNSMIRIRASDKDNVTLWMSSVEMIYICQKWLKFRIVLTWWMDIWSCFNLFNKMQIRKGLNLLWIEA